LRTLGTFAESKTHSAVWLYGHFLPKIMSSVCVFPYSWKEILTETLEDCNSINLAIKSVHSWQKMAFSPLIVVEEHWTYLAKECKLFCNEQLSKAESVTVSGTTNGFGPIYCRTNLHQICTDLHTNSGKVLNQVWPWQPDP